MQRSLAPTAALLARAATNALSVSLHRIDENLPAPKVSHCYC